MGVAWFVCSCGEVTNDHAGNICCEDCEESFCEDCQDESLNEHSYIDEDSCVFCTNKVIPIETLFGFAQGLLGLSKEKIENMYREADRKDKES